MFRGTSRSQVDTTPAEGRAPNALESWTLDYGTARAFGTKRRGQGLIMFSRIPAERIWATPFTGPGCFGESEYIVIGAPEGERDPYAELGSSSWK